MHRSWRRSPRSRPTLVSRYRRVCRLPRPPGPGPGAQSGARSGLPHRYRGGRGASRPTTRRPSRIRRRPKVLGDLRRWRPIGLRAIQGVELAGVVNRSAESTAAAARELSIAQTYPDWRALVADPAIDAVLVATWPYLHAPITLAALAAGKHVLTQARMAMNADEARSMLRASLERPDLTAMVVPSPLSFWCDATVARLLADGALGELRRVAVAWDTSGEAESWRLQRRWSGNNVMALGIVYESVARWLGHAVAVAAVGRI